MSELIALLGDNEILSGLVGGSLFASLLYALRSVPAALWEFFKWRCTCSLRVFSEDAAFERVNEWLSGLEYAKRSRQLRLTVNYDDDRDESREILSPGLGKHLIWYKRRPVLVERFLPEKGGIGTWRRFEDIRITTFGGSPALLQELIRSVSEARKRSHEKTTEVFLYRYRWRLACRKQKRPMDTVTLPGSQAADLVRDVQRFLDSKAWYARCGIPYRRGYLFEGPPGTGKTTLALALAGEFNRPIYALNLGSISNDDELIDAICDVPEHGILLIEDIDAAEVGNRSEKPPEPTNSPATPGENPPEPTKRVTLSGLLNVLDGVFSRDGRILIMTTNYPEKVDPALLRPGRADRREHIGELDKESVRAMCRRFFDDATTGEEFADTVETPIAPADLQERLLQARREAA